MTENMEGLGDILKRLTPKNTSASKDISEPSIEQQPQEPACKICGGKEWVTYDVPVGHPNFGKVFPCACQSEKLRRERTVRLLRYSNLDQLPKYKFDTLDLHGRSPDQEDQRLYQAAYAAAKAFASNPAAWLVLSGPAGSGKTHLAAAIGHHILNQNKAVFYVFVPDLLDHLRATYGPSSEVSYDELFEQVRNAQVLILDDLGSQSATPWAQEKMYQILNHRFNLELPTVITIEKPLSETDEPIWRRLSDKNLSRIYELVKRSSAVYPRLGGLEPEMLKRMTFDTFDVRGNSADAEGRGTLEAALRAAKNFAKYPEGWITFFGTTGCGKTHLAVAMTGVWLNAGRSVTFTFVPSLLDHLRRTFAPESRITYDELFEDVKTTPILVLDDLGSESTTPWAEEKLYQIIVHRHNSRLPTVITSRRFPSGSLAEAISSRLKDPTVNQLVPIAAPDYRDKERRKTSPATDQPRRTGRPNRPA